jgi:hypothetical protein
VTQRISCDHRDLAAARGGARAGARGVSPAATAIREVSVIFSDIIFPEY